MDSQTIFDVFVEACERFSDRPFLHAPSETASVYELSVCDYSYEEARDVVAGLKEAYETAGVAAGMRVGLALENRPEFFLHFLAINALGASISPLNCAMQPDELQFQLDHSECTFVVAIEKFIKLIEAVADEIDRGIPVVAPTAIATANPISAFQPSLPPRRAEMEAAILYTSGTTGRPKGCILSNEYFLGIAEHYTNIGGFCAFHEGVERILTPLPVSHMNALACSFMAAMKTGGCLIQLDRFHPRTWWKTVRDSKASIFHYLGVMPAMLLRAPETSEDNFSKQIRFAFGAGSDPRHHARFEKRFGISLVESWAMTETGAGAWITASHEPRHVGMRCFGQAPEGLEYKLVNEDGSEATGDTPGELLVRRSGINPRRNFFSAYFKDPAATEEAWAGGWFHTGDVVRVDEDGYFYFVDRRKNVIRRSGENIAAIDVESVLMRHEGVASCVVAPVPDEIRGDEVAALIVPAGGGSPADLAKSVFEHAMNNLIYFKTPGYIGIVKDIPLTASEKVKRGDAKIIVRAMVERNECYDFNAFKKQRKG